MITITDLNTKLEDDKIAFFPNLFSGAIINNVKTNLSKASVLSLSVGLAMISEKIYKPKYCKSQFGSLACIILEDKKIKIEKGDEKIVINCQEGSVLILGSNFRREWKYKLPSKSIKLYEENYIAGLFLSTKQRILYGEKVKNCIVLSSASSCPQNNPNLSLIGKGSYGNVYRTKFNSNLTSAVKFTRLKEEDYKNPYDTSYSSWHEVFFLTKIIKPLIQKNICPNLPLIYHSQICEKCNLTLNDERIISPCIITFVELAGGTLKDYLKENRSIQELYSLLFQIMAALHTIQYHIQLMNFDIKKENILYYDIEPGGYWQYTIKGVDYFVPNFGKLFILNDFGISRSMSPKYRLYKTKEEEYFRLGMRYAIIKDDKFIPVQSDCKIGKNNKITWEDGTQTIGTEFRIERKKKKFPEWQIFSDREKNLENNNIIKNFKKYKNSSKSQNFSRSGKFSNPEFFPPFEFYNDTQDVIRIFTGGKRTTQKGNHKRYKTVPDELVNQLLPFLGKGESAKSNFFSCDPSQVLASYFIKKFFKLYTTYTTKQEKIIAKYTISI